MKLCALVIPITFLSSSVYAFRIQPMDVVMTPQSKTAQVYVENTTDKKVRVRLEMRSRSTAPDGTERREPTEDITVEPTEVVVPAGERADVAIEYKAGVLKDGRERAYRLIAKQVDRSDATESISVRMQYVASVYVQEAGAKPDVVVKQIIPENERIRVVMENRGKRHQVLGDLMPVLKPGAAEAVIPLDEKALAIWRRENLLAGTTKTLVLPLQQKLPPQLKALRLELVPR